MNRIVILLIVIMVLAGCRERHKPGNRGRLEQLRTEAATMASRRQFKSSDSIGKILYAEAQREGDDVYMAYGLLSQGYYDYGNDARTERRLDIARQALAKALETGNDTLLSRAYNVLGSYSTLYTYDFASAIHYFTEAKRFAEASGAKDFAMAAECNISEIYHSMGDTLGLTYDLDIYDFARKTENPILMHSAAQHVAEHYLRAPATADRALEYISSIDTVDPNSKYIHDRLTGDYWQTIGDFKKAEEWYRRAMTVEKGSAGVYLSYGRLLNTKREYDASIAMLRKAEDRLADKSSLNIYRMPLYELLADGYHKTYRDREAFENLINYTAVKDSIAEFRNREQINKFRIRYELGKKELEITRSHASIRIRNIILGAILLLSLIIIASIIFYYRRRDRMLSVIIERQRELNSLRSEALMADLIQTASSASAEGTPGSDAVENVTETHPAEMTKAIPDAAEVDNANPMEETAETAETGGISEAKKKEIWSRIRHEISVNKIYRDTSVSRDIFAERVGCNHTWFSQVIKERTGQSYPQFMNTQRIEEALMILSDPSSSMTHEELWRSLGFLSKATFYSSFKARMSMSPAEYRKRALTEM